MLVKPPFSSHIVIIIIIICIILINNINPISYLLVLGVPGNERQIFVKLRPGIWVPGSSALGEPIPSLSRY